MAPNNWRAIIKPVLFQQRYAHNPLTLYQIVQQCLASEMNLVQRAEGLSLDASGAMANDTVYQVGGLMHRDVRGEGGEGRELMKTLGR